MSCGGMGHEPRTAFGVPEPKAHLMILRPRLLLAALVLTVVAPAFSGSVAAQAPAPTDDGVPPVSVDDALPAPPAPGEVVHSWALSPAGSDDPTEAGNRPNLTYSADPGAEVTDAVTLFNYGTAQLTFRVYGVDAFNTADGAIDVTPGTDDPTEVGSWVTMAQEYITVPPGQQATIPFTLNVPDNATPGDYRGAILASNQARSTGNEEQVVILDRRTGTQLFVRVKGPLSAELAIEDLSTEYDPAINPLAGTATVTYNIVNRGNVSLTGTSSVSIGGPFGLGKQSLPQVAFGTLLPGGSVPVTVTVDDVPAFVVAMTEVTLNPEGQDVEVSEVSRSSMTLAIPIAALLGLLALMFAFLGYRAYRRHQRRSNEALAIADDVPGLLDDVDADQVEPQRT